MTEGGPASTVGPVDDMVAAPFRGGWLRPGAAVAPFRTGLSAVGRVSRQAGSQPVADAQSAGLAGSLDQPRHECGV